MPEQSGKSLPQVGLFTDLYQLTMAQAYLQENMQEPAVFELYFRKLPECRNYIMAAGLDNLLQLLEAFRFTSGDLEYLGEQGKFRPEFLAYLRDFRFRGDVYAVREGTLVFPYVPIVQVVAPLPEAQLVETLVLNQIHFACLASSKAARNIAAAGNRSVVDFGSRRSHGIDAGMTAARSAYLAGAAGTSLVQAGREYGIPIFGTMAHSYIQSHDDEAAAFRKFTDLYPETTLLVDTFDTLDGVRKVVALSHKLGDRFRVKAIRLDSGDLAQLARDSRRLLDDAGLESVEIFASGGLDEYKLAKFAEADVPIDGYGVGTAMAVSDDAPSLDMAYKLVEYAGEPQTKLSSSKAIYPGRKQVFRYVEADQMVGDTVARHDEASDGHPLLESVMQRGERLERGSIALEEARQHARAEMQRLPVAFKSLEKAAQPYAIEISETLKRSLAAMRGEHE